MTDEGSSSTDMFDQLQHYYTPHQLNPPVPWEPQAPELSALPSLTAPVTPYSPSYSEGSCPLDAFLQDAFLQDPPFPSAHPSPPTSTWHTHPPANTHSTIPSSTTTSNERCSDSSVATNPTQPHPYALTPNPTQPHPYPLTPTLSSQDISAQNPSPPAPAQQLLSPNAHSTAPLSISLAEIDALLDNPLSTALSAQLSRPKPKRTTAPKPPASSRPTTALPSTPGPTITKPPPPKKKKFRPADRISNLEKHVATIVDQVKQLTFQNRLLQRKQQILLDFVQDLTKFEALANQIQADISHHHAHPSEPPRGAAAVQAWTPEQFVDFHNAQLLQIAQLLLAFDNSQPLPGTSSPSPPAAPPSVPDAPGAATVPAVLAELVAVIQKLMQATLFACYGRLDFFPKIIKLLSQARPVAGPEEEHWRNVLDAMKLSEEQEDAILMAREVFLDFTSKLEQEQGAAQVAIQQGSGSSQPTQAAPHTGMLDEATSVEEQVIRRTAALFRRHHNLLMHLTMFIFGRTLTPVQVARCALQAHPLLPEPIIMMNVLHAQRMGPPAGPVLGPQPRLATARKMADLL